MAGFDLLSGFILFNLIYRLRLGIWAPDFLFNRALFWFLALLVISLYIFDLYRIKVEMKRGTLFARTWLAVLSASLVIIFSVYIGGAEVRGLKGRGILFMGLFSFALSGSLMRLWVHSVLRERAAKLNWLFVGTMDDLIPFWQDAKSSPMARHLTCLIEGKRREEASDLPVEGSWADLDKFLLHNWSGIVFGGAYKLPDFVTEALMRARLKGVAVYDLADFYEMIWMKVPVFYLDKGWFVVSQGFQLQHFTLSLRLKRVLDFAAALVLLMLLWPLMLLVYLAVRLESSGPAIYSQVRMGVGEEPFTIYKFRSMVTNAESSGAQWSAGPVDTRITRVGRILRRTRLDELPQLWNVLRGEMSFIGPRPERPEFNQELEGAIPYFSLRHLIRPGLTGWAQVNYKYGASVEDAKQKLQYDLFYLKNYSLWLDFIIVLRTLRVILGAKGR